VPGGTGDLLAKLTIFYSFAATGKANLRVMAQAG